ncbi:MAG: hypothetical protein WDZ60_07515 [Wenzhouxiangellaceae bacterium]
MHRSAPADDLSIQQLRSIFLADQQFWDDRTRITLQVRAPQSDERDFVLNRIYQSDAVNTLMYSFAVAVVPHTIQPQFGRSDADPVLAVADGSGQVVDVLRNRTPHLKNRPGSWL